MEERGDPFCPTRQTHCQVESSVFPTRKLQSVPCSLIQSLLLRAMDAGCDRVSHCVVATYPMPHRLLSASMKSPNVDLLRSSSANDEANSFVGHLTTSSP
jgi:hypothetical protein